MKSYRKDEVTIEATAGGREVRAVIAFDEPLSVAQLANIRVAFEAGLREGLLLAQDVITGLGKILKDRGFRTVDEAVGSELTPENQKL